MFLTWIKNFEIFPQRFIFNFKRNAEERKQFYRTSRLSIPFMVFKYTGIILQPHLTPQVILISLSKFDVRSCPNGWLKWSSLFWEWQRNVLPECSTRLSSVYSSQNLPVSWILSDEFHLLLLLFQQYWLHPCWTEVWICSFKKDKQQTCSQWIRMGPQIRGRGKAI